jgi:hypothetical protein
LITQLLKQAEESIHSKQQGKGNSTEASANRHACGIRSGLQAYSSAAADSVQSRSSIALLGQYAVVVSAGNAATL